MHGNFGGIGPLIINPFMPPWLRLSLRSSRRHTNSIRRYSTVLYEMFEPISYWKQNWSPTLTPRPSRPRQRHGGRCVHVCITAIFCECLLRCWYQLPRALTRSRSTADVTHVMLSLLLSSASFIIIIIIVFRCRWCAESIGLKCKLYLHLQWNFVSCSLLTTPAVNGGHSEQ